MAIHAIIWDVGGVLVRTEDRTPRQILADQYGLSVREITDLVFGTKEDNRSQLGEISHAEYWATIQARLGMTDEETRAFESRFFAGDVVDYNLVDYIRNLREGHCTAILSNASTNLRPMLTDRWEIDDAFHHIIISAEAGLMKPDPAIYVLTLEKTGFAPEESVFIDDFPENIQAAKDAGMFGILFQSPAQARQELERLLAAHSD